MQIEHGEIIFTPRKKEEVRGKKRYVHMPCTDGPKARKSHFAGAQA
jgi:hypothetical protein